MPTCRSTTKSKIIAPYKMYLFNDNSVYLKNTISVYNEIISYEIIYAIQGMTEKRFNNLTNEYGYKPSVILNNLKNLENTILKLQNNVIEFIRPKLQNFSICIKNTYQFPSGLNDALYPISLFYYKGNLDLISSQSISIVGSRKCSDIGKARAQKMAKLLVKEGYTIVSGLAKGIDTAALKSAISNDGNVISVIGTPINEYYPPENKILQNYISKNHLLISHVPIFRYNHENFNNHKIYFPQRNAIMSAISKATIIIEASNTSGALTQARAALYQKRKLFILDSCFNNKAITWPQHYLEKGAIRVKTVDDVLSNLL